GLGRAAVRGAHVAGVLALQHLDRPAKALLAQAPGVETREAERALADPGTDALDEPADRAADPPEILLPVRPRPHLVPVDEHAVAMQRFERADREQREERKRRSVHHVVFATL